MDVFEPLIAVLNGIMDGSIPAWGLIVLALVGLVKAASPRISGNTAVMFNAVFALFTAGGFTGVNTLSDATVVAGVMFFAALYHRVWELGKGLISKTGASPLVPFLENPFSILKLKA